MAGRHVNQLAGVSCFQHALTIYRFIYPSHIFGKSQDKMILLAVIIVLIGKSMYQIDFFAHECGQN